MIPWAEARVHVLTHTLHYGTGVFEGIRAYETPRGPAIFRLHDHVTRLFNSAHIVNIGIPFSQADIIKACMEVVQTNQLSSAYIRPMCFLGAEQMGLTAQGLSQRVMIAAWTWDTYMGRQALEEGIKVKTSSMARAHVNSSMSKAKANGYYLNSMLALNEARTAGCDEALLLDTEGFVAEGSGQNIFIVRHNRFYTPEATSALEGITRDTVIRLLSDSGYEVKEKRMTRDEVYTADEAFFTGTASELTPIRELDGRKIGNGKRGPATSKLQSQYFDLVQGRSDKYAEWLDYIESEEKAYERRRTG